MNDVINAVLEKLELSLTAHGIPLYFDRASLNRAREAGGDVLDPPYALLLPVTEPADRPNRYRSASAAIFGTNVWGAQWQVLRARESLEWLRRYEVGSHGSAINLRYRLWTRSFTEQDALMPDGVTPVWMLSDTWRCQYENLAPYKAEAVMP